AAERLSPLLAKYEVTFFADFEPNPKLPDVIKGVEAFQQAQPDVVFAVGGGSVIDTAKLINHLSAQPAPAAEVVRRRPGSAIPGRPLIAVPTTAGTGSEATKVAVITDTSNDVKMMMLSVSLQPRVAVVDYELTMTMPRLLTAAVGVDTFTHGLEAFVSRKANAQTDPIALSCLKLVATHLQAAWNQADDCAARAGMMLASFQGGMAFSNSSVCLVHGMSRPIGAVFHVPHGLSNAILLPTVTRFSIPGAVDRYAAAARHVGCAGSDHSDSVAAGRLVAWLEELNQSLELPRLRDCRGVTREKFEGTVEKMSADALASGSPANNPRVPTVEEIIQLYHQAW
ncbi:MAG: iron-containing alcohol dehydrogenase, partial [Planctomycetota bacterium]|nr:iron-containing alcohol dehydrogenase [Planctomycetota bacterium]